MHGEFGSIQVKEVNMPQISIDVSTWTQTERNYLQAAAVSLLWQYDNSFDGHGITAKDGIIETSDSLILPSNIAEIWSTSKLKDFIVAELEKSRLASEAAQLEAQAKEAELAVSEFTDIKLAAIDAKIDAIANLAQLKPLLKKFVRFVVART